MINPNPRKPFLFVVFALLVFVSGCTGPMLQAPEPLGELSDSSIHRRLSTVNEAAEWIGRIAAWREVAVLYCSIDPQDWCQTIARADVFLGVARDLLAAWNAAGGDENAIARADFWAAMVQAYGDLIESGALGRNVIFDPIRGQYAAVQSYSGPMVSDSQVHEWVKMADSGKLPREASEAIRGLGAEVLRFRVYGPGTPVE